VSPIRSLAVAAAVLATAACGVTATPPAATPSSVPAPSTVPAPPRPAFADLTRGNSTSVVKLYVYDAKAHSAVVEPIIFMDGPAFCKKFKVKKGDPRCGREWTTEESHTRVTVPVVARPRLNAWENAAGDDCIGSMTTGSTCAVSLATFAKRAKANPEGFVVITVQNGFATKLAEMYTP
jgi:hypothetical protein